MTERRIVHYTFRSEKIRAPLHFAVATDLHSMPFDDVMGEMTASDAVLLPGDLVDRHSGDHREAARFLDTVPGMVPVFYSIGNHERKYPYAEEWYALVRQSKAVLLDNDCTHFRDICIGGLSSSWDHRGDTAFLERFEHENGYRLLMCHHPEMYRTDVAGRDIDLTLCGHAHGGQINIGGIGLYAPGQGFFPKLTGGVYDGGKMLLSRGMTNGAFLPRINNPCELIILELRPADETEKTKEG